MNETWENGKKPIFGPDFGTFGPNFVPKFVFVYFISTRYYKLMQAIIVCNLKKNELNKFKKMTKKT